MTHDTSLATTDQPQFGILPAPPTITTTTIGIDDDGRFYKYGDTPAKDKRGPIVPALGTPRILDVQIVTRGKGSEYGERPYLAVRVMGETPDLHYLLRLPCGGSYNTRGQFSIQHSVRSLLGVLCELDLQDTAVMLVPKSGKTTTFIHVFLDPAGQQQVQAPSIGPSRADLEIAVDRCRRSLGLPPQFPLSHDTASDPGLDQCQPAAEPAG